MDVWTPAHQLSGHIARRAISPVELVRSLLDRVERIDGGLHSYLSIDPDDVLAQARRAEVALFGDEPLGPLHGLPLSVKDTIDTAGLRTTYGSAVFADHVPDRDALVVERLRAAGAIIFGKTNTSEFAFHGRTTNRLGSECVNPWDRTRVAAGSSGGAAVSVACGLGPLAIGTDGGGSIRYPSAFCGIVGLMPSAGRVPKRGNVEAGDYGYPLSSIGPMTRDVRDAALLLNAISGHDPRDATTSRHIWEDACIGLDGELAGIRIGWLPAPAGARRDSGVEEAIMQAALSLVEVGAMVEEVSFVLPDTLAISAGTNGNAFAMARRLASDPATRNLLTPYLIAGVSHPAPGAVAEAEAWRARQEVIERLATLFTRFDLIAAPTTCFVAPIRPEDPWQMFADYSRYIQLPLLANIAGCPAASVPAGTIDGLPIGLQLMAPRGQDGRVLRAARSLERIRPWANIRPSES